CNMLQLPLVVIGGGRDEKQLRAMAGPTVRFLGRLSDSETLPYIAQCRAFLFPGEEDFGITPLEVQASGRPVIAYGAGGALASVVDGVTGTFFHQQTAESLAAVLASFDACHYHPQTIRNHALDFDKPRFQRRILQFIEAKMSATRVQVQGWDTPSNEFAR
ncbi:MAG TPA: glycosyltransferase, partial [Ktedonobacteraceae bacterium]|nr:glycosyltransferase [Ktedonobacteraceae bacterium]